MNRKRSVSKNENPIDSQKRKSVYNYIKRNVETLDFRTESNSKQTEEKTGPRSSKSSYMKDTQSVKNRKQISKKPKVSKPTKTIKMTISEDGKGKILNTDNSLRNSKESVSMRGSIHSKKTPPNDPDSIKFSGLSTTKPNTLASPNDAKELGSNPASSEVNKSKKLKEKKTMLQNCKSQTCFQKNPIHSSSRFNRLKKIKKKLDKQQNLISEISYIKKNMDVKKNAASRLKRSTSRTNRRNTLHQEKSLNDKKGLIPRSRSRTEFHTQTMNEAMKESKNKPKKTTVYTLKDQHHTRLSRNNSGEEKDLKSKSFLRPTYSSSVTYKSHLKSDSYSTFLSKKPVTGKKTSISGVKPKFTYAGKSKNLSKEPMYKTSYLKKNNLAKALKKSKGSSVNRSKKMKKNQRNYKGLHRCGSVNNPSPMHSLRETVSSRRKNIRKGIKNEDGKDKR